MECIVVMFLLGLSVNSSPSAACSGLSTPPKVWRDLHCRRALGTGVIFTVTFLLWVFTVMAFFIVIFVGELFSKCAPLRKLISSFGSLFFDIRYTYCISLL